MKNKFNFKIFATQIAVCLALLLLSPLGVFIFTQRFEDAFVVFKILYPVLVPCFTIFFLNYYLLLPSLFYRAHKIWFFFINIMLVPIIKADFIVVFFPTSQSLDLPPMAWLGIAAMIFANILAYAASVFIAWSLLNARRTQRLKDQLAEEKQRHIEAELGWLKNQINPHFLFNTLNNISSLVAIDVEQAQDCISHLSDLMRYAMYESNKPSVPLSKEVEFMQDYMSLMNLRCSGKTEIITNFDINTPQIPIAPLLLVSFIENAYKHGISNSKPSFIHMSLTENDGTLVFACDNSNFPKAANDHSGNGIGLQNMRRRLGLLYPGRYTWEQTVSDDVYHVRIVIHLNHIGQDQQHEQISIANAKNQMCHS